MEMINKIKQDLSTIFKTLDRAFKHEEDIVIFDIGSLNALEAIEFGKKFVNSKIYCFEPNPPSYKECLKNTYNIKNIEIVNKAIYTSEGSIDFYPINTEKTITTHSDGNPGASSLLKANPDYPYEKYEQNKISVESTRVDKYCELNQIHSIDFAWIDVQGVGLTVLKSFGEFLTRLKVIHIEAENYEIYQGQEMFKEINEYLTSKGFLLIAGNSRTNYLDNFIFVRKVEIFKFMDILIKSRLNLLKYRIRFNLIPRLFNKIKRIFKL